MMTTMADQIAAPEKDSLAAERLRGRVEYWKQTAAVQMHFNDLCIRTRWLGLTAIATLLAAAAVSEKESISFALPFKLISSIELSSVLMLVSIMVLVALWALDIQYYYKMLIASIEYGEKLEESLTSALGIDDKGLTAYITSQVSRERALLVSRGFYMLVGALIVLFLLGTFLPKVDMGAFASLI